MVDAALVGTNVVICEYADIMQRYNNLRSTNAQQHGGVQWCSRHATVVRYNQSAWRTATLAHAPSSSSPTRMAPSLPSPLDQKPPKSMLVSGILCRLAKVNCSGMRDKPGVSVEQPGTKDWLCKEVEDTTIASIGFKHRSILQHTRS